MFKRVILEEWHQAIPYLGFALIAGAFILIVIRALRLKPPEIDHLSSLPLKSDDELKSQADTNHASKQA